MAATFGHWIVDQTGITWDDAKRGKYFIPIDRLMELRHSEPPLYDWVVHIPPKTWLNRQDVYDLNNAFLHAATENGHKIDEAMWQDSMDYQADIIQKYKPE